MMADPDLPAGMPLHELLRGLVPSLPQADCRITGLSLDSRTVTPGNAFLALHGSHDDGSRYCRDAAARGAALILLEQGMACAADVNVPVIPVAGLRDLAGLLAARFYGNPSDRLRVVGITGTNGKTSVSHFIARALEAERHGRAGCIGTLGYGVYPDLEAALNTTPDAVTVQRLLAGIKDAGADCAIMEVSSHALVQGRVNGVAFDTAVFTNLSHEHLDYHGDMDGYFAAKRTLFQAPGLARAVINADDAFGRRLLEALADSGVESFSYGLDDGEPAPHIRAALQRADTAGLELDIASPWGAGRLAVPLIGRFNASNLLAAIAVLCLLDLPLERVLERLAEVQPVPGRMEAFGRPGGAAVIVDYAHTPDAITRLCETVREITDGHLFLLFGCGGDRDKGKRSLMGKAAVENANFAVITSDNPRSEDPESIIEDIKPGLSGYNFEINVNRQEAIESILKKAGPDDAVLLAGKGAETYQEIKGERYSFSDIEIAKAVLTRIGFDESGATEES